MKYSLSSALLGLSLLANPGIGNAQGVEPFLGQAIIVGFNFCPQGWLPMDGRFLPINQYTALFSLLGTTYGGDGIQTFALPNAKPIYTATRATFLQCIATQGVFPSRP